MDSDFAYQELGTQLCFLATCIILGKPQTLNPKRLAMLLIGSSRLSQYLGVEALRFALTEINMEPPQKKRHSTQIATLRFGSKDLSREQSRMRDSIRTVFLVPVRRVEIYSPPYISR